MKYRSIIVTQRGGPEVLQVIENDLRPPSNGEARVRVLATPVCQDDVAVRLGKRPFLPKMPFVPGYATIGIVDALGEGVNKLGQGDRVGALTNYGSYAEYVYWDAAKLVPVPTSPDLAQAATIMLNYLVGYQVLHRVAKVKPGDKVLIVGASGGVGTAFLQLGKLSGLIMYGLASESKHPILAEYGATPIDYRTQDFVQVLHEAEPEGLDFVFNGMAEDYFGPALAVLRKGGALVHYGGPENFSGFLRLLIKFVGFSILPNGKSVKGYGTHRVEHQLLAEDWSTLFKLLEEGQIRPVVAETFPLLEAAKANALLESGQVTGNIVLLAPELLDRYQP